MEASFKNNSKADLVFLVLSGIFLGSLTLLNILGTSRFLDYSFSVFNIQIPFVIAIGVLPYPITFLCTDLISELFGRKQANRVVWMGLVLNIWVFFFVWVSGYLDSPVLEKGVPAIDVVNGEIKVPNDYAFYHIRKLTMGATIASMIAYVSAQFIDVQIFHFLKEKTKGKKLWLRNNVSTIFSQLIDSIAVILITHYLVSGLPVNENGELTHSLIYFIISGYLFKLLFALIDTIPFYWLTHALGKYLKAKN